VEVRAQGQHKLSKRFATLEIWIAGMSIGLMMILQRISKYQLKRVLVSGDGNSLNHCLMKNVKNFFYYRQQAKLQWL